MEKLNPDISHIENIADRKSTSENIILIGNFQICILSKKQSLVVTTAKYISTSECNSGSSSYDSTSSSSTVHLLRKAKNKERDDNEDLATIIRYLVDNQNPRNTKYTNIKSTERHHGHGFKTKPLSEISQINMNDYLEIPDKKIYRYTRNVTQEMLEYSFEIWNTLRYSYYPSDKEQKQTLKEKENFPDYDKFDYLYKALPASLRITTNIIAYQGKGNNKRTYLRTQEEEGFRVNYSYEVIIVTIILKLWSFCLIVSRSACWVDLHTTTLHSVLRTFEEATFCQEGDSRGNIEILKRVTERRSRE
ncbi:hypothetical protein H8356DRAFT_1331807 [Neocallimastix lanati (nom. inval.)]|nr:hypothetical protein H8356DRAFT_1331807 [Neocallimastix sp. JGI-2020a]